MATGEPARPGRRIACLYWRDPRPDLRVTGMDGLRFFRMAEALARRGHEVDILLSRRPSPAVLGPRLREVPFRFVRWDDYEVVKTVFYTGFGSLLKDASRSSRPSRRSHAGVAG